MTAAYSFAWGLAGLVVGVFLGTCNYQKAVTDAVWCEDFEVAVCAMDGPELVCVCVVPRFAAPAKGGSL